MRGTPGSNASMNPRPVKTYCPLSVLVEHWSCADDSVEMRLAMISTTKAPADICSHPLGCHLTFSFTCSPKVSLVQRRVRHHRGVSLPRLARFQKAAP